MTEKSPASAAHNEQQTLNSMGAGNSGVEGDTAQSVQPEVHGSLSATSVPSEQRADSQPDGQPQNPEGSGAAKYPNTEMDTSDSVSPNKHSASSPATEDRPPLSKASSLVSMASIFFSFPKINFIYLSFLFAGTFIAGSVLLYFLKSFLFFGNTWLWTFCC